MAKGTPIDPGFIGVPQFKRSTFDPVQFTQQMMGERRATKAYEGERQRKERQQNIDFLREQVGEVDIQAWEDQQGYRELSEKKQAIYAKALDASNRGYNLYSPETPQEQAMMREFQQELEGLESEIDVWNIHKGKVAEVDKKIAEQSMLPAEERTMDIEGALQWKKDYITGKGPIQERARGLQRMDFGVAKPLQAADMNKYMAEEIGKTIPGMDQQIKSWQVDPVTGDILKTTWEGVDPTRIRTGLRKVYNRTEGQQREFLDAGFDQAVAQGFEGDLNDWMVEKYAPEYAEKTRKTKLAGLSASEKRQSMAAESARPPVDTQGNYDLSEYVSTKRYGTTDADGNVAAHAYQSRATLPMLSIFGSKGFPIPVTDGTVVKSTGQKEGIYAAGTTPVDVSFIPTATEKISIEVDNPETGAKETVTIEAGERIPGYVRQAMTAENIFEEKYNYIYKPYVEANVYKSMMKDPANPNAPWEVPDPKSEKMTTIRPYNEIRNYLKTASARLGVDFKAFDNDVLSIQKQLNEERIKENEQYQSLEL